MSDLSTGLTVEGNHAPDANLAPIASVAIAAGTPCYINALGQAVPAVASAVATSLVVGLAMLPAAAGEHVYLRSGGGLNLSKAQWDAITDGSPTTGIVPGTIYYLSPTNVGNITATKPGTEGQVALQLGIGLSANSLFVQIRQALTHL